MSRKDYELIAKVFHDAMVAYGNATWNAEREVTRILAEQMAQRLAGENSRFDRGRFLKACGVKDA